MTDRKWNTYNPCAGAAALSKLQWQQCYERSWKNQRHMSCLSRRRSKSSKKRSMCGFVEEHFKLCTFVVMCFCWQLC